MVHGIYNLKKHTHSDVQPYKMGDLYYESSKFYMIEQVLNDDHYDECVFEWHFNIKIIFKIK